MSKSLRLMVHSPFPRRLVPVVVAVLATALAAAPAAAADTTGQTSTGQSTTGQSSAQSSGPAAASTATTAPLLPLPSPTTTSTTAPPTTSSTAAPAAASPQPTGVPAGAPSGRSSGGSKSAPKKGVPSIPVGGPPTTTPPPGTKPAPAPTLDPILVQVDADLAQLTAISDYKPAQALVAKAQGQVTTAAATLLSARQSLDAAKKAQVQAALGKAAADNKLRQMAIAAYIGVGFTSPGLNEPAQGNGTQGPGTVSTPEGLTGISAIDAREMLVIVGEHARQNDDDAVRALAAAVKATRAAAAVYRKDQAQVSAAEARLLAAQQTLKLVANAAVTPGAASATPLSGLLDAATTGQPASPATQANAPTAFATAAATPPAAKGVKPTSPAILGQPALTASQIAAWWATLNRKPNITVPIDQLINSYAKWGSRLGVRYDVAFAQSIVETGYFSFPSYGQLTPKDNNFAGIGACDTCARGWSFPSADTGVEAQMELLRMYATDAPLPAGVKNVIGGTGVGGCCTTWTELAGKWASSTVYGVSIMTGYQKMLAWAIPQEEVSAGLIAPSTPAAEGPSLAPLPQPASNAGTRAKGPGVAAASLNKAP